MGLGVSQSARVVILRRSNAMNITLKTQAEAADVLIIPVVKTDELTSTLAQIAERVELPATTLQTDFTAGLHEVVPVYLPNGAKTFLLGMGETPGSLDWLKAFRKLIFSQKDKLPAQVAVDLIDFDAEVLEAVVLGIVGGGYDLRLYQTDKSGTSIFFSGAGQLTLFVAESNLDGAEQGLARAEIIAEAQRQMMDLTNAPGNYKTPQTLADWATSSGKQYGYYSE